MRRILALGCALSVIACHHAVKEQAPAPPAAVERYTLAATARPYDLFCVQGSVFDEVTSEDARGTVCVTVAQLRVFMHVHRYAN